MIFRSSNRVWSHIRRFSTVETRQNSTSHHLKSAQEIIRRKNRKFFLSGAVYIFAIMTATYTLKALLDVRYKYEDSKYKKVSE